MYLGILTTEVVDQHYERAQPAEKNAKGKTTRRAKKEVPEKTHTEVRKIFLERDSSEVEKNKGNDDLDYYEIIAEPGKASLKKV